MDWVEWHAGYDDPDSRLAHRLRIVQEQIRAALDRMPPGPLTALSMCAGQGRDLLEVLAGHPRRDDVRARLVELDPRNVAVARDAAWPGIDVVQGDAGLVDQYAGVAPADLVVACGVFGNLTDTDVERTVAACGTLTREGGTVVWTRHRGEPDRVPDTCRWFAEHGFDQLFLTEPERGFGVGAHRFARTPAPLEKGARMFTFVGSDILRAQLDP